MFASDLMPHDEHSLAGRRLLFVNWRDPAHPESGGAEVYCWEIARRLAVGGAHVTLLSSRAADAPVRERTDGIEIIRAGGRFGVYLRAASHLFRHRSTYDAVIDMQNGIPFFAPLLVAPGTAVVCVIHHVHQQQFSMHFPWPMSTIGRLLEGPASRLAYRSCPTVVVSPSTRAAVRRQLGFRGPIFVVPNGTSTPDRSAIRSRSPRIALVTRLVAHKRIDLLVRAIPGLRERWPDLCVDIAGDGPDRSKLVRLVASLGIGDILKLHGRVSDAVRAELLGQAWLTVNPSAGEGWGLAIVESNAHGVPAVAYDVPGLRDSVVHDRTGWLVEDGTNLEGPLDRALTILSDPRQALAFGQRCRRWAFQFTWDDSAERLARVVLAELERVARPARLYPRRADIDLACVARFAQRDLKPSNSMRRSLRRTDHVHIRDGRVTVVLHGCDEDDGLKVLRRLGVSGPLELRLARGADVLAGAEAPVEVHGAPGRTGVG